MIFSQQFDCKKTRRNSPNQPVDDPLSMSFLNLRSTANTRPNSRLITDLPDPLLKVILQNCSSVDMTRCSLVNKQFREVIEDMEDEKTESLRSCQKAKIFICDRRRAILEGVSTIVPTRLPRTPKNSESSDSGSSSSSSIASTSSASSESGSDSSSTKTKTKTQQTQANDQKDTRQRNQSDRTKTTSTSSDSSGTNSKAVNFISDQYTDTADPNWAFAFDFESWLQEYEVNEVYLKNFCSFLEREKIDDSMSPSAFKGRTAYYESQQLLDRTASMSISANSNDSIKITSSDESELKSLSSGRIERLAQKLGNVRGAHYIFKDSVCYGARPPATIFYFLGMMRQNTRAVTFDHVQAATKVELHDVLDMANLQRLTVIQPEQRQCVNVRSNLLINWIKLPDATRKRISIHLVGCKEFRPKDVFQFVEEWVNTAKPVIFKQIAIDGGSYKYNEFVTILERLHDFIEKRPPRSPLNRSFVDDQNQHSIVFDKVCRIPHPKDRRFVIQLKYCKNSRRMVLTIEKDAASAVKTLSPVSTLTRLARPQSAAAMITTPIRKISSTLKPVSPIPTNNTRQLIRPLSHDPMQMGGCRENVGSNGSRMFNKLVSFLGTSS